MRREVTCVVVLALVSFALSRFFWWLPGLILMTGTITYAVPSPLPYLIVIAIMAEFLSVLPVGVTAVTVLTPWLVKYLGRRISVDVSFFYLVLVATSVTAQLFILFLPDSVTVLRLQSWPPAGLADVIEIVPWLKLAITAILATLFVYGATVFIHFNFDRTW